MVDLVHLVQEALRDFGLPPAALPLGDVVLHRGEGPRLAVLHLEGAPRGAHQARVQGHVVLGAAAIKFDRVEA